MHRFWGPEIVILACTIFTQFISEGITNFSDSSSSENIRVPSIQSISSSVQSPQILHNPVQHETLTQGSYYNETLTDYLNSKGIRPLVKFCLVVHPKNLSLQTLKNQLYVLLLFCERDELNTDKLTFQETMLQNQLNQETAF